VDAILKDLSAEDFGTRQRASKALDQLPADAFEMLEKVLADAKTDIEARQRIEAAMPSLQRRVAEEIRRRRGARDQGAELAEAPASYEKVGRRNPAWDEAVGEGVRLFFGKPPVDARRAAAAFKKALESGCGDPLVMHLFAAADRNLPGADQKNDRELAELAAGKYAASAGRPSAYPARRRMEGMLFALRMIRDVPGDRSTDDRVKRALFDEAVALWPEAIHDPGISTRQLDELAAAVLDRATAFGTEVSEPLLDRLAVPLAGVPAARHIYNVLKGREEMREAWKSRGNRVAAMIPAENLQEMTRHVSLARAYFEQAFALDVFNPDAPSYMIEVELLDPQGRPEMEKWFERAMIAGPNNLYACNLKLNYLLPRWYGSHEEMLAFGRECLKKGFKSRIPLTLIAAHQQIAEEEGQGDGYFASPEVWADVKAVYEGLIAANPSNMNDRGAYLQFAVLAGQWATAREQQERIGNHPDMAVFKTPEHYGEICAQIAEHPPGARGGN
jgi:hypothetical protein